MAQIVKLRRSSVIGKKPTNAQLELGELSINTSDGKLFFAKSGSLGPSVEEIVTTNTINTGSVNISGSLNIIGPITGSNVLTNHLEFETTADPSSNNGNAFVFYSGSLNDSDLYFSEFSGSLDGTIKLNYLKNNLYTGLLHGGTINAVAGATTYDISAGEGVVVELNASIDKVPYPVVYNVKWDDITGITPTNLTTEIQTFVGIDKNGDVVEQGTAFNNGQYNTVITLGTVLHANLSTINATISYPNVAYGYKQRTYDFIKAFGGLKLSGFDILPSGSLGVTVASGTAWADGRNYQNDPNDPSYIIDTGTTVSKIYRYYQVSGTTFVRDTNNGLGYTDLDPTQYVNNGVLTTIQNKYWSIQRIFWYPNSASKSIVVYYGNTQFESSVSAIANIPYERFVEEENTKQNAIYLGALVLREDATFLDPLTYAIIPGGIFRNVGGTGGGGAVPSTTLNDLIDVTTDNSQNGDLLVYNSTLNDWKNSKSLNGNYQITGSLLVSGSQTINGNLTLSTLTSGATDTDRFLISDSGVIKYRTGDQVLSDIGAIGGTIASGQVAFGTGTGTIGGSNNFFWDNTNGRLGVGTTTPTSSGLGASPRTINVHISSGNSALTLSVGTNFWDIGNVGGLGLWGIYNNSARFVFTNAGLLGLLTTTPTNTLDVNGTGRIRNGVTLADTSGNVLIGTTTDSGGKLQVSGNGKFIGSSSQTLDIGTSTGVSYIQSYGSALAATPLLFYTGTTERMRIASDGNVGVGTISPTIFFHIRKDSIYSSENTTSLGIDSGGANGSAKLLIGVDTTNDLSYIQSMQQFTGWNKKLVLQGMGGNVLIGTITDSGQKLQVNGNAYVSGNVGIGTVTTGTTEKLVVRSGASGLSTFVHDSGLGGVRISGPSVQSGAFLYFSNNYNTSVSDKWWLALDGANNGFFISNGTERMRITSSGEIGIATTSPTNTLDVNGTARVRTLSNASGDFVTTDANGVLQKRTASEALSDIGAIGGTIASGQVAFGTASNTIGGDSGLTWDNVNKRLGVGITPAQRLHISTSTSFQFRLERTGTSAGYFELGTSSAGLFFWGQDGLEKWRISQAGILQSNGAQIIQTSTGNLTIATGGGNGDIILTTNGTGRIVSTRRFLITQVYSTISDPNKIGFNLDRFYDHSDGAVDVGYNINTSWNKRSTSNISLARILTMPVSFTAASAGSIGNFYGTHIPFTVSEGSTVSTSFIGHYIPTAIKGTTGTVSTFTGFQIDDNSIASTALYGFKSGINSGTGKWGLYFDGTANNHLAGNLLIGTTNDDGTKLRVVGITNSDTVYAGGQITSSAAKLQVNGFMRTGTIYLHTGDTPTSTNSALSNVGGDLHWNSLKVFHDGYHPNADTWTTARTLTIGSTGKSVNGSANVSWSLAEIGAQAAGNYVTTDTTQTITGNKTFTNEQMTLSGHFYRNIYTPSTTAVYDHYYPNGGNGANVSIANLRVWDGSSSYKALIFSGGGSFTWDGNSVFHDGYHPNADTLTTARTINGTSFNGSANITTSTWGTARNITIGSTTRSVDGSTTYTWTLAEIGAAAASHTHAASQITAGTFGAGDFTFQNSLQVNGNNIRFASAKRTVLHNGHMYLGDIDNIGGNLYIRQAGIDVATVSGYNWTIPYDFTVNGRIVGVKGKLNTFYNNLGSPMIEEYALIHGQMTNKFRFISPALQEESIDGITWITSTRASSNQLGDLMRGEGEGTVIAAIPAPTLGGTGYYRLTWNASQTGYVALDKLYIYCSTNGNQVEFIIERKHNTNGWETLSSGTLGNWPGHVFCPHSTIWFHPTATTHYGEVRVTFRIVSAAYTNPFSLFAIEWFGGYPAGKRNAESYDRNKNVTFPNQISSNGFIKVGGTSSQFLKADGSVDSTTYATASAISGTTNYIPKFTASATIGNSQIFDNGTDVGIGTTSPERKLHVAGSGVRVDNGTGTAILELYSTTDFRLQATTDFELYDVTSAATRLKVLSTGNVLIGSSTNRTGILQTSITTDNSTIQNWYDTTGNLMMSISESGDAGIFTVGYAIGAAGRSYMRINGGSNNTVAIFSGFHGPTNTNTIHLTTSGINYINSGNLLIGTTTDNGNKLRVNGSIYSDAEVKSDKYVSATANGMYIAAGETPAQFNTNVNLAAEFLYLGAEGGFVLVSSSDNWSSGWAGRNQATLVGSDGSSSFPGNISTTGQFISTRANSVNSGGGQIYLNGATGNRIDFNANGVAAPTFTTRSAGTKIVLYPSLNASSVDYAFGITSNTLWTSVPTAASGIFSWYGGTTEMMKLTNSVLTLGGNTVWNSGNDGSGSGLDADLIDGQHLVETAGNNGVTWGRVPFIKTDGVMEVGGILDFHDITNSGVDYGGRFRYYSDYFAFEGVTDVRVGTNLVFHDGYHPNADTWTTARTLTIGSTGKSVNGSANVSWSLAEIGAIGGSIAAGQVAFGTASNTIGGDSGLTWDNTNKVLTLSDSLSSVRIHGSIENSNYFVGNFITGESLTSGVRNIGVGYGSLRGLTTGENNIALGYYTAHSINGSSNIGIGGSALANSGNGNHNIGIGFATFGNINSSNQNASYRIGIGYAAGANSPGSKGIYIGYYAGSSINSGNGNVVIGGNGGSILSGTNNNIMLSDGDGNIKLLITTAGNTLIGTTTDNGSKLQVNGDVTITNALLTNQENLDVDSAAPEVIAQISSTTYSAAFFDYVIKNGTNLRAGTVYAVHDGTNVEFTETSTNDLGTTSGVTLSVDLSGGNIRLLATVTTDNWVIKSLVRGL